MLVTCTNGELGDAPGRRQARRAGSRPEAVVVPIACGELEASCELLGVTHLELLGYHDSGMAGWPQNDAPRSFWRTPVEEPTGRLADLMRTYQPQVVVTYDENGFYGHPDHIQANRITTRPWVSVGSRPSCTTRPCPLEHAAACVRSSSRPESKVPERWPRTPTSGRPTSW